MISCSYNNKKIKSTQQFRTIRDYKLLTKHTLNEYFSHNDTLNTIFNYTDPEIVANILIKEITLIINCIAPPKKIQFTNNYAPWIDQEFINQSKIKDNLHTKAKLTNSETDWRIFRFQRNHVNNLNNT